jgi:glutathionylspermidine synthase
MTRSDPATTFCQKDVSPIAAPLWCGPVVKSFREIRNELLIDCCKWDSQVGDASTLCEFPLLMNHLEYEQLSQLAVNLTLELERAEQEITTRPELLKMLGLPKKILRLFERLPSESHRDDQTRVYRYDFHPTAEGWKISEVNSDVPGGYTEASSFTELIARHAGSGRPAGNPARTLINIFSGRVRDNNQIALLTAPGYMEDHQIVAYLGKKFEAQGFRTHLAKPEQLEWRNGLAALRTNWFSGPIGGIIRFYQGEWLCRLRGSSWQNFFRGSRTPVCNPGIAIITESKRFPLVWPHLRTDLKTWEQLLPEAREPSDEFWLHDEAWILKSAFGNTGDAVACAEWLPKEKWQEVVRKIRRRPEEWVAQKRFEVNTVQTPSGAMRPSIGLYVIAGKLSGIYGRLSSKPWIDFSARDVAVLISNKP